MNPRVWAAAALLFLAHLVQSWRILLPGITPYPGSIESGYAYMAKLFAANPNYLTWNPLQYGGIPMHYVYLPLLPYANALISWLAPWAAVTDIHRAVCATALFLTPAAVFLFIRDWTGRPWPAFYSALVLLVISPLYWMVEPIRLDRGIMDVPWRVQILIKYGEGPHTVGILLLFTALILVRRAALRPGFAALLAAAISLAATVLTNWVAGLALAFAVLMLLLANAGDQSFRWRRVLLAGLLGYALAAFWLTPSFIAQMAYNWPQDAFGFQFQWLERAAMAAWAAGLLLIRYSFQRLPHRRYLCWVTLCVYGYGLPVLLFYRSGINAFPEARRYALEFELCLLLLVVECFRLSLASSRFAVRAAASLGLLVLLLQQTPAITRTLSHGYRKWQLASVESSQDYRIATALNNLHPAGRIFASGGTRFRLNAWYPIPQVGGVFETGLKTRTPVEIAYQVRTDLGLAPGTEAEVSILLLRAYAVEYVVIQGHRSSDYYRDFKNPRKFEGVLEKVWEEKDDAIFRVTPVRYAHIIKPEEIPAATVRNSDWKPWYPYVNAMLDPARPVLQLRWTDASRASITGKLGRGAQVAFAIPWDPNFRAFQNGQPVPLHASAAGLLYTAPLPADSEAMELRFVPSAEEIACALLSLATAVWCGFQLRKKRTA